jgi:hypothetical protein
LFETEDLRLIDEVDLADLDIGGISRVLEEFEAEV